MRSSLILLSLDKKQKNNLAMKSRISRQMTNYAGCEADYDDNDK